MGSIELFPTKSSKKMRSSKVEGIVTVSLPSEGSAYSNPSFVKGVADSLLLPANHKRLANISPVQTAE